MEIQIGYLNLSPENKLKRIGSYMYLKTFIKNALDVLNIKISFDNKGKKLKANSRGSKPTISLGSGVINSILIVLYFAMASPAAAADEPFCATTSLRDFSASQLSGSTDGQMQVGEVYLYQDVAVDAAGNTVDLRIEAIDIAASAVNDVTFDVASGSLNITSGVAPTQDPYVALKMSIVVAGSATASNLAGVPAVLNNATFELLDIDSQFASADQTDVGGYSTTQGVQPDFVVLVDTVALPMQNGGGPANFNTYLQTPIIQPDGTPTWNGVDKGNNRDNYVSLNYSQLTEAVYLHGSTGSRTRGGTRGAAFAICGEVVVPPATLTLEKTVINDDDGAALDTDWTLQATDGTTAISGIEGSTNVTSATVPAATYTLSESGPTGYTQTSLVCTGTADTDPSDGLKLSGGENATCTFTNDDDLVITLPTEITSTVCAIEPATEFWTRRAEWSSNGADPLAPVWLFRKWSAFRHSIQDGYVDVQR